MRSNIPLWKYTTAAPAPLFGVQNVSVEYLRSLSGAKYIFVRKSVFFGYELKLLISTAGGRFPRAWLEPPCASHSGVSRLMLFEAAEKLTFYKIFEVFHRYTDHKRNHQPIYSR